MNFKSAITITALFLGIFIVSINTAFSQTLGDAEAETMIREGEEIGPLPELEEDGKKEANLKERKKQKKKKRDDTPKSFIKGDDVGVRGEPALELDDEN